MLIKTKDKDKLKNFSFRKYGRNFGIFCGVFGLSLAGLATSLIFSGPTEVEATGTEVQAQLTAKSYFANMAASDRLNLDVEASADGAYNATKDTLNIKTNAPSGYKLFMSTDSSTSNSLFLRGDTGSSDKIDATTNTVTNPGVLGDNTWGFAIPGVTGFDGSYETPTPSSNSKWAAVPKKNQDVEVKRTNSATPSEGENVQVYYGAKVNTLIPHGEYTGSVKYTLIADEAEENLNQMSVFPSVAVPRKEVELEITTGLSLSLPSAADFSVKVGGQNCGVMRLQQNSSGNIVVVCKVTEAMATPGKKSVNLSAPKYGTNLTLDEGVEFRYDEGFKTITYMQEMTPEICAAEPRPKPEDTEVPEKTLVDLRDNKTYVVRKLADGNCWMSQNLALSTTAGQVLTDVDTDLLLGRTFTAPGASNIGDTWSASGTVEPHYLKPQTNYEYFNNGDAASSIGQLTESAGNYYNWSMATAGARDASGNSLIPADNGEAADSICPKGWRLPPYEGDKSYRNLLFTSYMLSNNPESAAKLLLPPFTFVRAGRYVVSDSNGFFTGRGEMSILLSSTVSSSFTVRILVFNGMQINIDNHHKYDGDSVRCVAR